MQRTSYRNKSIKTMVARGLRPLGMALDRRTPLVSILAGWGVAGLLPGLVLFNLPPAYAAAEPLRVGVVDAQLPCSDGREGIYKGSAVDIWQVLAQKLGVDYQYVYIKSPSEAVRKSAAGEIDVAVSCLNMTPSRLQRVTFAVPYTEDGLTLLARRKENGFIEVIAKLYRNNVILETSFLLFATALAGAITLWLLSRRFSHKDIVGDNSLHTFFKGWMMLVIGSGIYKMGSSPPSMTVVAISNFVRTIVTAIFVASATSLIMQPDRASDISDRNVLRSALKTTVGVDAGTISQDWLEKQADQILPATEKFSRIKPLKGDGAMIQSLELGKVGSLMADSSRISFLLESMDHPRHFQRLGRTFNMTPQSFIFGSRLDPALQRRLNIALSELRYDGVVDDVLKRWQSGQGS